MSTKSYRQVATGRAIAFSGKRVIDGGTSGPEGADARPVEELMDDEATSAPQVGTADVAAENQLSNAALVKKFMEGDVGLSNRIVSTVFVLGWLVAAIWLMIQDNSSGGLTDLDSISKYGLKLLLLTLVVCIGGGAFALISRNTNRRK